MTSLKISCHAETRNKFRQQVNLIKRISLGPLLQEVMSLPQNHLTNVFISSYRWATVIKFSQQKQLLDRSP